MILAKENKVICYAIQAQMEVENQYSQTDQEMLEVVNGVKYFHLLESKFNVITDQQALAQNNQKPETYHSMHSMMASLAQTLHQLQ